MQTLASNEGRILEEFLQSYRLYWPSPADALRAYDDFAKRHLSHGIGILDVLIAETAVGLGARLLTFNTGHYRGVASLQLAEPYAR